MEHYSDLYSRQNTVYPEAFDSLESLQTMDELDPFSRIKVFSSANDHLSSGIAPRANNVQRADNVSDQDIHVHPVAFLV